jgi:hypothetical protein
VRCTRSDGLGDHGFLDDRGDFDVRDHFGDRGFLDDSVVGDQDIFGDSRDCWRFSDFSDGLRLVDRRWFDERLRFDPVA